LAYINLIIEFEVFTRRRSLVPSIRISLSESAWTSIKSSTNKLLLVNGPIWEITPHCPL